MLMRSKAVLLLAAMSASLSACTGIGGEGFGYGGYSLVRVHEVRVGDHSLAVTPPRQWNRVSARVFTDIRDVEDWTQNGPYLDGISFVSGLKDGKALVYQRGQDDRQVPKFRSNMTPPEIAAILESLFRVRGGAVEFTTTALAPRPFLGANGFQLDYEHLDSDEVRRKGRAVGAVVNGKLYLILFDAARSHYYNALLPDFEAIVNSARRV
jgi:hypothetical protein